MRRSWGASVAGCVLSRTAGVGRRAWSAAKDRRTQEVSPPAPPNLALVMFGDLWQLPWIPEG